MRCASTDCHRDAFRVMAQVPLCLDHIQALKEALGVANAAADAEAEALEALKANSPEVTYAGQSLVYYIGRADAPLIKIGVTQNLHKRLNTLTRASKRLHLLAVEPGGYYIERKRHREFRALREQGTEWFQQAPVLTEHIANLVRHYGPARCNCPHSAKRCPIGH